MNEPHKLDYAVPKSRARHSPYATASICVASAVISFDLGIRVWNHWPQFLREETLWILGVGPIVGILFAVRAWCDVDRKQILTLIGLVLNVLAFLSCGLFLASL